jgi:hypothetical protein
LLAEFMTHRKYPGYCAAALLLAVAAIASIEPGRAEDIRLDGLNIPAVISGRAMLCPLSWKPS